MKERVLKQFFEGGVTAHELAVDLAGSMVRRSHDVIEHRVVDMNEHFLFNAAHLVRLCDAVVAGTIEPAHLETIGFCLIASDRFAWPHETEEGDRISEVLHDWAAPEINYPLTSYNVGQWRRQLLGQSASFERHPPRQQPKNRRNHS